MNNPHEQKFIAVCLSGYGDEIDAKEEDAQILLDCVGAKDKIDIYLSPQTAYDFALWLIAAASRIEGRYPEMIEEN